MDNQALAAARGMPKVGPPVPEALIAATLPTVLPAEWQETARAPDGVAYRHRAGYTLLVSFAYELDGHFWQHLSIAHPHRLPSWEDLRKVKDLFIGREREAYQVLPMARNYVNQHPCCLHLWARLDGPALPDFTRGMGAI